VRTEQKDTLLFPYSSLPPDDHDNHIIFDKIIQKDYRAMEYALKMEHEKAINDEKRS